LGHNPSLVRDGEDHAARQLFVGLLNMKTFFAAISLLVILAYPAFGEFEVTDRNLEDAFEIPGSRSPNGQFALYCINRGDTTAKFIGIMPTSRESLGLETQLFSHGSDRKGYKRFLKVVWSSDSNLVAAHDSSKRHSELFIYAVQNEFIKQLRIPDFSAIMKSKLPTDVKVQSSGQIPMSWLSRTELLVLVRLRDKNGNMHEERFKIDPISGEININAEK
jgi:hypothetical protein